MSRGVCLLGWGMGGAVVFGTHALVVFNRSIDLPFFNFNFN